MSQDLVGQKFNRLSVIKRVSNRRGYKVYLCICDCGNQREIRSFAILNGNTKSCGCYGKDLKSKLFKTYGSTRGKNKRLYAIWQSMKRRCYKENCLAYPDYGGRGIKVCDRWLEGFKNFYDDMSPMYREDLTIERIDFNGNYEPDNCKWATRKEQARNRRSTVFIETLSGTLSLGEAAKIAGVSYVAIKNRIKQKWPIEKLLIPATNYNRVK